MQHFYSALRSADSQDKLWDALKAFFEARDITHICSIRTPPSGKSINEELDIQTEGYPAEWTRRYIDDKLYQHDPIPLHAQTHPTPFRWSDIGEMRRLSRSEKDFLDEFEKLGVGDGIAIPVFGPRARNGYVGIALRDGETSLSEEELREFQFAAQIAHQRYCELRHIDDCGEISLSQRETEILEWVARGKSNTAIAEILGISNNTVDTHLRRIFEKLAVSDRTTAAIRGIGCGLINL